MIQVSCLLSKTKSFCAHTVWSDVKPQPISTTQVLYVRSVPVDHSGYWQLSIKLCFKASHLGSDDVQKEETKKTKVEVFVCYAIKWVKHQDWQLSPACNGWGKGSGWNSLPSLHHLLTTVQTPNDVMNARWPCSYPGCHFMFINVNFLCKLSYN